MVILYIEDNRDDRELVRILGAELGIIVSCIDSVDIKRYNIIPDYVSMVLLDINMPCKDGITVLRDIKETQPNLPVVILSGTTEYFDRAIEAGAEKCIKKGIGFKELTEYLESLL